MTRHEWQRKARDFSVSAKVLLENGQFDSAYYLVGIAVECALKAKIVRRFRASTLPDKKLVNDIYRDGHELGRLIHHAQLADLLAIEERQSATFKANWAIVQAWQVDARYKRWSEVQARDMVEAVTSRGTGVLSWIGRHW